MSTTSRACAQVDVASGCWKIVWNIAETIGHLSFRDLFVEVLREIGAASLPRCIGQHFGNGVLDAFVGISGDKEYAGKSAGF